MKNEEEKMILDSSPEAASIQTVTGWVSSTGRFFGKDERMARYDGSTHRTCVDCGIPCPQRSYTVCDSCRGKRWIATYNKYPFKAWDLEEPVYSHLLDKYFFTGSDDIEFELEDNYEDEERPKYADLQLVFCEPNRLAELDFDIWSDAWPEDGEPSEEFVKRVDEFNKWLATQPPASYSPSKIRTEYLG